MQTPGRRRRWRGPSELFTGATGATGGIRANRANAATALLALWATTNQFQPGHSFSSGIACPTEALVCLANPDCSACVDALQATLASSEISLGTSSAACQGLFADVCDVVAEAGCDANDELAVLASCVADDTFGCAGFTSCADVVVDGDVGADADAATAAAATPGPTATATAGADTEEPAATAPPSTPPPPPTTTSPSSSSSPLQTSPAPATVVGTATAAPTPTLVEAAPVGATVPPTPAMVDVTTAAPTPAMVDSAATAAPTPAVADLTSVPTAAVVPETSAPTASASSTSSPSAGSEDTGGPTGSPSSAADGSRDLVDPITPAPSTPVDGLGEDAGTISGGGSRGGWRSISEATAAVTGVSIALSCLFAVYK